VVRRLIDILAQKDAEWVKMAMSFGIDEDSARDLVHDMYIRLETYVDDPERVMYNEDEVNTFYVYVTLRNLYLSGVTKKKYFYFPDNDLKHKLSISAEEVNYEREEAFGEIIDRIRNEVNSWYWYDRKLWEIHFDEQRSMRSISNDTRISLSSIFNTLKRCKNTIRDMFKEDVEDFNNEDYDRI